jgi:hypothetical protein
MTEVVVAGIHLFLVHHHLAPLHLLVVVVGVALVQIMLVQPEVLAEDPQAGLPEQSLEEPEILQIHLHPKEIMGGEEEWLILLEAAVAQALLGEPQLITFQVLAALVQHLPLLDNQFFMLAVVAVVLNKQIAMKLILQVV